jgi:hypothetical protein
LAGKFGKIPSIFFEEYFKMLQEILCKASFEVKITVNMDSLDDSARRKLCKLNWRETLKISVDFVQKIL